MPSGFKGAKVGFEAGRCGTFLASSNIDLLNGPVANAQVSTRFKDFLLGADVSYDIASSRLDKYTASVALDRPREKVVIQLYLNTLLIFLFRLTGFQSLNASYFQKLNNQLEIAYKAFWSAKSPVMSMEVGAKYMLQGNSFVKAKIDNYGKLGLSLSNELRPGMQLTLGASLDTNKLQENAHKFGIELNYFA